MSTLLCTPVIAIWQPDTQYEALLRKQFCLLARGWRTIDRNNFSSRRRPCISLIMHDHRTLRKQNTHATISHLDTSSRAMLRDASTAHKRKSWQYSYGIKLDRCLQRAYHAQSSPANLQRCLILDLHVEPTVSKMTLLRVFEIACKSRMPTLSHLKSYIYSLRISTLRYHFFPRYKENGKSWVRKSSALHCRIGDSAISLPYQCLPT